MEITIRIDSPDLVKAAQTLADALNNMRFKASVAATQEPATAAGLPQELQDTPTLTPAPEKPAAATALEKAGKQTVTLEQLRARVNEKIQAGKRDAVKKLLEELKVDKVTNIPPERYAEAYEKAAGL